MACIVLAWLAAFAALALCVVTAARLDAVERHLQRLLRPEEE